MEKSSYFLVVDKYSFKFFGSAKITSVYEKDRGPNTGGMGAYSPAPIIKNPRKKIINKIANPH